jgi:hypothetical protein
MPERHVTWENFQRAFVEPAVPAVHPVTGVPEVRFFVDEYARRIGLLTALPADASVPGPSGQKAIETRVIASGDRRLLEVATSIRHFFPQFFAVMTDLADRIQLQGKSPSVALLEALRDWQSLLQESTRLGIERQLGLLGELWLLGRLRSSLGPAAVDAWVGPTGDAHDFRVSQQDFEVKSTLHASRLHVVNGLSQLAPEAGRPLYVVSLQYTAAGAAAGESLAEAVERVLREFESHHVRDFLEDRLGRCGYSDDDAGLYTARFRLRGPVALIPIDDRCPALTQTVVTRSFGHAVGARLRDVSYTVDFGELGALDQTPAFLSVIP